MIIEAVENAREMLVAERGRLDEAIGGLDVALDRMRTAWPPEQGRGPVQISGPDSPIAWEPPEPEPVIPATESKTTAKIKRHLAVKLPDVTATLAELQRCGAVTKPKPRGPKPKSARPEPAIATPAANDVGAPSGTAAESQIMQLLAKRTYSPQELRAAMGLNDGQISVVYNATHQLKNAGLIERETAETTVSIDGLMRWRITEQGRKQLSD